MSRSVRNAGAVNAPRGARARMAWAGIYLLSVDVQYARPFSGQRYMVVGELTTSAVSETRMQAPKAIADLNGVLTKAAALGASLAKYDFKLNVPQPIRLPEGSPARRSTNPQR